MPTRHWCQRRVFWFLRSVAYPEQKCLPGKNCFAHAMLDPEWRVTRSGRFIMKVTLYPGHMWVIILLGSDQEVSCDYYM